MVSIQAEHKTLGAAGRNTRFCEWRSHTVDSLAARFGLGVALGVCLFKLGWETFTTSLVHFHPITSYDQQAGFLDGEKEQLAGDMR